MFRARAVMLLTVVSLVSAMASPHVAFAEGPDTSWQPPSGATPEAESALYLEVWEKGAADPATSVRTSRQGAFRHYPKLGHLASTVVGDPDGFAQLRVGAGSFDYRGIEPGTYVLGEENAQGRAAHLTVYLPNGRTCAGVWHEGWIVVDRWSADQDAPPEDSVVALQSFRLRFDVTCGDSDDVARARGMLRFDRGGPVGPRIEPEPIPADFWRPHADAFPASGNYAYEELLWDGQLRSELVPLDQRFGGDERIISAGTRHEFIVQLNAALDGPALTSGRLYRPLPYVLDRHRRATVLHAKTDHFACNGDETQLAVDWLRMEDGIVTGLEVRRVSKCGRGSELRQAYRWDRYARDPDDPFRDDDGAFEDDIEAIAEQGITRGCNPPTNDRFCPLGEVTRGQMAAFLRRALGLSDPADDPFRDDDSSIFEDDIERLAASGITRGCGAELFCPDRTITREQMAAFLARALALPNVEGDRFRDDDASIFEDEIEAIADAGITIGCNPPDNDRYCPDATVSRRQMAAFLNRATAVADGG